MDEIMNEIVKKLLFEWAEIEGVRMLVMDLNETEAVVHVYHEEEIVYKFHIEKIEEGLKVNIGLNDQLNDEALPMWLQRDFLLPLTATIGRLLLKPKAEKIYH